MQLLSTSIRLATLSACLLASPLSAQIWEECNVRNSFFGDAPGDQFGWVGVNAGDVDGDQVDDVIIGAPFNDQGGLNSGKAIVYSGASGAVLFDLVGQPGETVGFAVAAAGDVNADGFGDVIIGAPGPTAPKVYVLTGPTGNNYLTYSTTALGSGFGSAVSSAGDVDADGFDDLIVGAPGDDFFGTDAGRVTVISGLTGFTMRSHFGESSFDSFGSSVGCIRDRNGDQRSDYLVGAANAGPTAQGRAYVYSGIDGNLDCTLSADASGAAYGQFFCGYCGDVNADGSPDFFVSDFVNSALGSNTGRAYVYSGVDCSELLVLTGSQAGAGFGIGRGWAGDYNGDGYDDLFFGSWLHPKGAIGAGLGTVHSGLDGSVLATFTGDVASANLGFDAAGMGDVDGDGVVDFLLTAATDSSATGAAYLVTGAPELPRTYCDAAPNSAGPGAQLEFRNSISVAANELALRVTGGVPLEAALLIYGTDRTDLPFGNGRRCVTGIEIFRLPSLALNGVGFGQWAFDTTLAAAGGVAAGSTWHFQCVYRDSAAVGSSFNTSNALRLRFCP